MSVFHMIVVWFRGLVRDRTDLATENLALRQQLAVLTVVHGRNSIRGRFGVPAVLISLKDAKESSLKKAIYATAR